MQQVKAIPLWVPRLESQSYGIGARVPRVRRGSRHGGRFPTSWVSGLPVNAILGREPRLRALASRYSGAARTLWASPRTFVVGASGCRPLAP
jgi:hypothetical protein